MNTNPSRIKPKSPAEIKAFRGDNCPNEIISAFNSLLQTHLFQDHADFTMGQVLTQLEREYAKSLNANRTRGCASTQEIISQVEKYKPEDTSLWLGACDLFSKSGWKASLEYNGFDPLDSQFYFTVDQDVVLHST